MKTKTHQDRVNFQVKVQGKWEKTTEKETRLNRKWEKTK